MQGSTNQHSIILFSAELFSDTRLSQQQTGGVLLHIEDWLAGVQRSSRQKKPLKTTKMEQDMQNKPNFKNGEIPTTPFLTKDYGNKPPRRHPQNKPKQTQNKANFDLSAAPQSQNKPNQTQFPPENGFIL